MALGLALFCNAAIPVRGPEQSRRLAAVRQPDPGQERKTMPSMRTIGVAGACCWAMASISPSQLHAQEWPTKPVKIVVAFSPGASADQLERLLPPPSSP